MSTTTTKQLLVSSELRQQSASIEHEVQDVRSVAYLKFTALSRQISGNAKMPGFLIT